MLNRAAQAAVACAVLAGVSGCAQTSTGGTSTKGVTLAEYRSALEEQISCVNEAGYRTTEPVLALNKVTWTFQVLAPQESADAALSTQSTCYEKYLREVERAYFTEHVPTGAERDALFSELLECLDSVDVTGLDRTSTEEQIVAQIARQTPNDMSPGLLCLEEYRVVFPEGMFPE